MFSAVHALTIAARPFPEPERLVQLYSRDARTNDYRAFSYQVYEELSRTDGPFTGILAHGLAILRQTTVSSSAAGLLHLIFIYIAAISVSWTMRSLQRRKVSRVYPGPVVAGRFGDGGQAPAGMIRRIGPGTAE